MTNPPLSRDITRITLSVLFIGLLLAASFWIIRPFLLALIWATTIVVATSKRGSPAGRVNPRRSPAVRPRGTTGLVSPRAEQIRLTSAERNGIIRKKERKMKSYVKICALILALGQAMVWSGGCAGSQAGRGAAEGAVLGTVGGAVAGAVGALIFGGNVAQGAAAGAAMGAASGAATGAVSGAMADSKIKDQQAKQQQAEALKEKIGDQNFEAANLLAHCKHRQAIGTAQKAYSSTQNPEQRLYALYIQAVAAEESGDQKTASSAYAQAIQDDPSRGPEEKIRAKCLEGVMKAQKVRQDYGLPPLCK